MDKPQNRQQRRLDEKQQRFSDKINAKLDAFVNSYIDKFMDPNVTDDELDRYEEFLVNRWKTYCHVNRFKAQAFGVLGSIIQNHRDAYEKQKNGELILPSEESEVLEQIDQQIEKASAE